MGLERSKHRFLWAVRSPPGSSLVEPDLEILLPKEFLERTKNKGMVVKSWALSIKPDFYEGLLALGQQQFEMAKLHWSFALAKKIDLSSCDSTEMLKLFDSAEEKMKVATRCGRSWRSGEQRN